MQLYPASLWMLPRQTYEVFLIEHNHCLNKPVFRLSPSKEKKWFRSVWLFISSIFFFSSVRLFIISHSVPPDSLSSLCSEVTADLHSQLHSATLTPSSSASASQLNTVSTWLRLLDWGLAGENTLNASVTPRSVRMSFYALSHPQNKAAQLSASQWQTKQLNVQYFSAGERAKSVH